MPKTLFNSCLVYSDTLDTLEESVKAYFRKCQQPNCRKDWREEQFNKIKVVSRPL